MGTFVLDVFVRTQVKHSGSGESGDGIGTSLSSTGGFQALRQSLPSLNFCLLNSGAQALQSFGPVFRHQGLREQIALSGDIPPVGGKLHGLLPFRWLGVSSPK